jgi:hypothetical protein
MSKLNVNFADVETFDLIPVGTPLVEVEQVEAKESQSSEFPYLNWKLRIVEDDEDWEESFVGRYLWLMTSLSPKALFRLKQVFENIGVDDEDIDLEVDDDTNLVTEPELVGIRAYAPVRHEPYNGEQRARVSTLLPEDDGPAASEDEPDEDAKPAAKKKTPAKAGKPAQKRRKFQ